ncbi:hypothetical protein ABK040_004459 [Willaertia magna]
MTSLDWLSISGIRSFDPSEPQTIKFQKPLTIILGANGAGKTTIIECLKCATTGELPPNSDRGKSFIHDPKVLGDSEVKGQIRLQFKAANKKRYVTVRSFQLSQTKKKMTFKQLESVLQTKGDDGEIKNSSFKCTEMDKLIPECMGVSKAILENVIFCHQEEVNWPLGDNVSLKKKFDDIFASTRYSKALDAIKKTKKEITAQFKEFEKDLAVAETEKNQADKLKKEAQTEVVKLEKLKDKRTEIENKLNDINQDIEKYEGVYEQLNELKTKLREKETQKKMLQNEVNDMYNKLEQEFTETDEEVKQFEQNFVKQLEKLKQQQNQTDKDLIQIQTQRKKLQDELTKLSLELGSLNNQKEAHENRLQDLYTEIYSMAQKYKINGYDNPPYSVPQTLDFLNLLNEKADQEKKKLEKERSQHHTEQSQITLSITDINNKKNTINSQFNNLENKRKILQKQIDDTKEKLNKMNIDENLVKTLESEVNKLEELAKQKQEQDDIKLINQQIINTQKELRDINQKIFNTNNELKTREKEKDISFRIKNLTEENQKILTQLNSKLLEAKEAYEKVLGSQDPEMINQNNIESKIKVLVQSKNEKVQKLNSQLKIVESKLSISKGKLESFSNQEKKLKQSLESKEKLVVEVIPSDKTWDEIVEIKEKEVKDLRNDVSMTEALKKCYENFIKLSRDHSSCPVCERPLSDNECSAFEELQRKKLEKTPKFLAKKQQLLSQAEIGLNKIKEIKPVIQEITRIKTKDLVDLEKESEKVKVEYQQQSSSVDELAEEISQAKIEEKKANELLTFASELRVLNNSLNQSQQRIKVEENELKKLGINNDQVPYEQLKKDLEESQQNREKLNSKIQSLNQELSQAQNQLTKLKDELREKQKQLQQSQFTLKEKQRLNETFNQKQTELEQLLIELNKIKEEAPTFDNQLKTKQQELQQLKIKHKQEESIIEDFINQVQNDIHKINASAIEIKRYTEKGVEDNLQIIEQKITKLNIQIDECQKQFESKTETLKKCNTALEQQNVIKLNIEANLKYRQKKKELEKIEKESDSLNKEIVKLSGNDTGSSDSYQDIKKLKEKQHKISSEKSQIDGMRSQIKGRVKNIQNELNSDQYKDIENKHKSLLVKSLTTKYALEDLDKYSKALEKALTKYHSMKMAEINEIIKELWQKTYRGNDIDTICIKCDTETSTSTTRKSSYNYRVAMVKGDVELNMRGRSSAGQKVLSSLIIRLALADAFSIDCGVLALDEPTTNLDLDNVNSLAEALRFLIEDRMNKKTSNFQLIVITHDEDFVHKLGKSEFVDYYYRVSKDPVSGCSAIEQQQMKDY